MKKRYFEEIDGLRFYVFLLILTNHTGIWLKSQGHTFFFMLSGFLIGYSSFNDILKHGSFSLKRYAIRRILRTFPLYFLIILSCGVLYVVLKKFDKTIDINNYWSYFLFIHNYFVRDTLFILKNLWAMAVTEQLYLVWGVLVFLLQRKILKVIIPLIILMVTIAFLLQFTGWRVYHNTLTYAGIYLLGAYAGLLQHRKDGLYRWLGSLSKWQSIALFIIGLSFCIYGFLMPSDSFILREYVLGFSFWVILIVLCYTKLRTGPVFVNPVAKYLGSISYGMYCYHAVVITTVTMLFSYKGITYTSISLFIICLFITIIIAIFSYEFYEKKFLKLKGAFR